MEKLSVSKMIGQQIARYRKAGKMTQVDFGKKIGVSQPLLASYETGRRNIPVAVLLKCADVFEITVSELIGETVPAKKRGPQSILERQIEDLRQLPASRQKLVSELIDTVLKAAEVH